MLDLKWIRTNFKKFNDLLVARGCDINLEEIIRLDKEKREIIELVQQFQKAKNIKSKMLRSFKKNGIGIEIHRDITHINEKLIDLDKLLLKYNKLQDIIDLIPNLPLEDVPIGSNESMNKLIRNFKEEKYLLNSKTHEELGKNLGMMDFIQTVKISGSRFVTLKGGLARLERALINFMLDIHTIKFNYEEVSIPSLVKSEAMYNVGQLPKFAHESYATNNDKFRLIPTAEVPLTNMVAGLILSAEEMPKKYVACSNCYRLEAGSAGKDSKGMFRTHQFSKVELVTITTPNQSEYEHQYMLNAAETVLKQLDIPYRIMLLCRGDMGFSACKTYDIEVWLPGQKKYREISSVSNCGDFQARRMKAKYKDLLKKENIYVHTLNGSALAVGRTIVAIMENYQNSDGSITIPKVLVPYMGGVDKISKSM